MSPLLKSAMVWALDRFASINMAVKASRTAPVLFGGVFFFMLYYGQNCQNNFYNQSEIDGAKQHEKHPQIENISGKTNFFSRDPPEQPTDPDKHCIRYYNLEYPFFKADYSLFSHKHISFPGTHESARLIRERKIMRVVPTWNPSQQRKSNWLSYAFKRFFLPAFPLHLIDNRPQGCEIDKIRLLAVGFH